MLKIGFVGSGNMAEAMIFGLLNTQLFIDKNIYVYDLNKSKSEHLKKEYSINISNSNTELVKSVDIIVFAVKPYIVDSVISSIRDTVTAKHIILSIAAGIKIERIEAQFNKDVKIARTMPNTAALINEGITAICFNRNITNNEKVITIDIIESFGKSVELPEEQFDIFTSICASSPAFVYLFIDALAQSGKDFGINIDIAFQIVAQAFLGASKMIIETKENPLVLLDKVCTKGGTTIEGVKVLEQHNIFDTIKKAAFKTAERSKEISSE